MAFNQVTATSLTPSRPAPPIPIRQASTSTAFTSGSSLTLAPSLVSTSSYATSYSGIGGTPNIGGFPKRGSEGATVSGIIRQGSVGFKEDAFASWIWREKWLVLREQSLSVHKNEVSLLSGSGSLELSSCRFQCKVYHPPAFLITHIRSRLLDEQCIADEANSFSY
jgi:protein-serine/threonine kinase